MHAINDVDPSAHFSATASFLQFGSSSQQCKGILRREAAREKFVMSRPRPDMRSLVQGGAGLGGALPRFLGAAALLGIATWQSIYNGKFSRICSLFSRLTKISRCRTKSSSF